MDAFTARPEKIIGNVALASLMGGFPAGVLVSIVAFALSAQHRFDLAMLKDILAGGVLGSVAVFVCGSIIVAPALFLLRHFGFGGPFFVHAISIAVSLPFFANGLAPGLAVSAMACVASFTFCRFAYGERRIVGDA